MLECSCRRGLLIWRSGIGGVGRINIAKPRFPWIYCPGIHPGTLSLVIPL